MNDEEWDFIESLFHAAREMNPEERVAFLDRECDNDPSARQTIEALLREDAKKNGLLDGVATDSLATTLSPGMIVGPYEVVSIAGVGGMGQVYRAIDRRLRRDVAIKALPVEFIHDRERLERLQSEATVLASLNDPNVAAIYDLIERENEPPCLILEFVPGATLAESLKNGPFTLDMTLKIAHQIATALEAAHDKGIVHRDLKPANIKLTPDEKIKILDFGVARVLDAGDNRPADPSKTGSPMFTHYSGLAGTPAYMSPEQALGLPVDQRADIWAFGCVAYEMLTGRKAFTGETASKIITSVVKDEPDWSLLPASLPLKLRLLLRQCLTKEAARRLGSVTELRQTVEKVQNELHPPVPTARRRALHALVAAALLIVVVAGGIFVLNRGGSTVRLAGAPLHATLAPELELDPAISPDGKMLAYVFRSERRLDVYIKALDGSEPINVTKELPTISHRWPRWSRDGARLAFVATPGSGLPLQGPGSANSAIHIISWPLLQRGASQIIEPVSPVGHAWSPNGKQLAFVRERAIYSFSIDSKTETKVAETMDPNALSWSPNGKWIAYTAGNSVALFHSTTMGNLGDSSIGIVPAQGGEPRFLVRSPGTQASPVWLSDSKSILFVSTGGRQSRDVFQLSVSDSGEAVGEPVRITAGLDSLSIDISPDGHKLVYSKFLNRQNLWSIPVPGSAPVSLSTAKPVTSDVQIIEGVSLSHDGKWIAFDSNRSGNQDIYRMPREGGRLEQLTTDRHDDFLPFFSHDGKSIAFYSFRNEVGRDIYVMNADGSNQQQVTGGRTNEFYPIWSSDDRSLVYQANKDSGLEVYVVSRTESGWGPERQVTNTEKNGLFPKWSPDDKTIAYLETTKGLSLISPDGTNNRLLVSTAKTSLIPGYIAWPPGDTVYFKANGAFWSVKASGGEPKQLVKFDDGRNVARPEFATDGKDFFFTISERGSDIWVLQLE